MTNFSKRPLIYKKYEKQFLGCSLGNVIDANDYVYFGSQYPLMPTEIRDEYFIWYRNNSNKYQK